jgi:hypothetical protein
MIGRNSAIGLALLFAFSFCALAAQSAVAQVGTKAVNTTAVTCIEGAGNEDFSDEHCDDFVGAEKGEYGHAAVAVGETKELDAVNDPKTSIVLQGTAAGVATEVTCNKMTTVTKNSAVHNIESSGKHTMTGNGTANFTECTVTKPGKCVMKEPVVANATFEGVEGLGEGKNEMGVEFKGEGAEKNIAELFFQNKGEEKCTLLNGGKPFVVKGTAIGTSPSEPQTEKHTGATIKFESGNKMQTLEMGLKPATVKMTVEPFGAGGKGNPIPITTTT